jgi:V-type H+-transporting ATPase subunit E
MIVTRSKDVRLVESLLSEILANYSALLLKEANLDVKSTKLTVNKDEKMMLPANSAGGVKLVAHQGKIVCDNTLDTYVAPQNKCSFDISCHENE